MSRAIDARKTGLCSSCQGVEKCLLSFLNEEDWAIWKEMLVSKIFGKNDFVFLEDEKAEGLYMVCSGGIKLIKSSPGGQQQILSLVGPGGFCGFPPLISQRTHFCTAQAIARTELNFIPRDAFLDFLKKSPSFTFNLIDHLSSQLRLARLQLQNFSCKTGRPRIADLLLWLGRDFGRPAARGIEISFELSRADLASMAGLTTETTIRILSSLRQEGLLEAGGPKRIVLLDPQRLSEISGSEEPFAFQGT
ncbi:MAG TPA: Crp/Fnr family transcriptional regulator [Desulfuromonadales bacterium]|nr:Crp/Fnr family transcriptional regulator [Desulfuromonadales bacterium]